MVGAFSEKLMSSVGKCSWDPAHWRFRAEEARTVADQMTHEEARSIMRRIANDYGRLAKLAELADQGFDEPAIEGGYGFNEQMLAQNNKPTDHRRR
jgi:hypothetical protein